MAPYPPPNTPSSSSGIAVVVGLVVALVALVFLAVVALAFFGARAVASRALAADGGSGGISFGGGAEHLQWDANESISVLPVDVNGDGVEDFVGRFRRRDGDVSNVYVGAFDGNTFARLWTAGPYGTVEQAAAGTPIAIAGSFVVLADFRAQAHVLDLVSGKETAKLALTDRASSMCSPSDGRKQVWIEVSDRKNVVADLAAPSVSPAAERPAWCGPKDALFCATRFGLTGACAAPPDSSGRFQSAGLAAMQVLVVGGDGVALGMKTPGTPSMLAVGFDPKTFAIRWRTPVAPDPTLESSSDVGMILGSLAAGRVYTSYTISATPAETHVIALDAATGARLLDARLPHTNDATTIGPIVVSAARIYVPHWTWLDVLDGSTGKVLGSIGVWPG
jgi:outer membrane protein assembly factor BamB